MKKPRIPPVDEKQVLSLLKEYDCPVPYHEVRTRFLGNIATPAITASPMHIVKGLWGGELPEFESLEAVNDLVGALINGLWNSLTRHQKRTEPFPEEWLLTEWPEGAPAPTKHWLSSAPESVGLEDLVGLVKLRWRIERDYEEMKGELGLDHYEGRSWPGFHHHTALCVSAYAFLATERARLSPPGDGRYQPIEIPALPTSYRHRGAPVAPGTAPAILNHNSRGFAGTGHREPAAVLSHMPSVQHSSAE